MKKFDLTASRGEEEFNELLERHFGSSGTPLLERHGVRRVSYGAYNRRDHNDQRVFELVHLIATRAVVVLNAMKVTASRSMVAKTVADATVMATGNDFPWHLACGIIEKCSRAGLPKAYTNDLEELDTYVQLSLRRIPKDTELTHMSDTRNDAKIILWAIVFTFLVEHGYGPIEETEE